MSYPLSPVVEMLIDGAWTSINSDGSTSQVYQRDEIVMRWGRANEQAAPSPATINVTLNNRSGKFSPRNPLSAYYGKIGRNTPMRVRLGTSTRWMELPGAASSYATTPDAAALDITGDIDIRVELQPLSWRPDEAQIIATKYATADSANQRSWGFELLSNGTLWFAWSPDGTFASRVTATSTAAVTDDDARRAIRVTLDVNNGAAGKDVKFWTASSIGGAWTQLGSTVTTAGTTSIFSSTAPIEIGSVNQGLAVLQGTISENQWTGAVYEFELRNGIGGALVADTSFTSPHASDLTFVDATSLTWTLEGAAAIVDSAIRAAGEVSSWPTRWDVSGNDVFVPVEASGIRRRLGQGAPTLRSAMYRGMTGGNVRAPVAYWPCEDGDDATLIGSAFSGYPAMRVAGDVNLASHSDLDASAPIPTFGTGYIQGLVPAYTVTNYMRCMALVDIPDSITGTPNIMYLTTTGSVDRWYLSITSVGSLNIRAVRRDDDVEVLNSTPGFDILGQSGLIWIYLTKNGSDVDYQIGFAPTGSGSIGFASGTVTSTIGIARRVICGGLGGDLNGMAIGHVVVQDVDEFWDITEFANAWAGETAVERIVRLCAEEQVPVRVVPPGGDAQMVGPQRVDTFLNLVDAAAAADQGILADDRDAIRLLYRPGQTLYNQDVALTVDYSAGEVAGALEPVEDDQLTRNDITAQRPGGSSARAILETGALSVLPPPDGVGRYDDSQQVIVHADGQLRNHAGWLLHLGTIDEARYPHIAVHLGRDPSLSADATAVHFGDRIQVTNPPAWLPPEDIDQLAQGGVETLNRFNHQIVYNCTPASPWTVAVADDTDLGRADTAGSELASSATSGATSISVATTLGPLWTTSAGEMPFDIRVGGEVMRVTAVSGAASPQTFTVTRSINGITKAHSAGADVRLAQPAIAAL